MNNRSRKNRGAHISLLDVLHWRLVEVVFDVGKAVLRHVCDAQVRMLPNCSSLRFKLSYEAFDERAFADAVPTSYRNTASQGEPHGQVFKNPWTTASRIGEADGIHLQHGFGVAGDPIQSCWSREGELKQIHAAGIWTTCLSFKRTGAAVQKVSSVRVFLHGNTRDPRPSEKLRTTSIPDHDRKQIDAEEENWRL